MGVVTQRASSSMGKIAITAKRTLASQLGLRYMPDLAFFYDESFDYGARIDTLLRNLKSDDGPDNSTPEKE